MHIIIDLINGDGLIVESDFKEKEKKKDKSLLKHRTDKLVQKQVININGEIVSVNH